MASTRPTYSSPRSGIRDQTVPDQYPVSRVESLGVARLAHPSRTVAVLHQKTKPSVRSGTTINVIANGERTGLLRGCQLDAFQTDLSQSSRNVQKRGMMHAHVELTFLFVLQMYVCVLLPW